MPFTPGPLFRPRGVGLLLRFKARALRNHLAQAVRETPLKLLTAAGTVLLIWAMLHFLFLTVFKLITADTLQGIVAIPLMLDFFFVILMIMLVFSNAIIAYGSLFAPGEPADLLCRPIRPSSVALLKFLESLFFSSWSLILIGLPLMVATSRISDFHLPWYYYPLFTVFFLSFIPIPGAIGLFVAAAVGLWFSRIARRVFYLAVILVTAAVSVWIWNVWDSGQGDSRTWLNDFFDRASLIQGTFWPSRWISSGLNSARDGLFSDALFYLLVTVSNALFLSWLSIKLVGGRLLIAYDRVQAAGSHSTYRGRLTAAVAALVFWYLPTHLREIALKDLRTFLRDPTQWSQLVILLGLLGLYVLNIPNVPIIRNQAFQSQLLVSFLNTAAISLILATFTSRFVFPLISLEAQQLWLVGLAPMPRGWLLVPKFVFALTITLSAGCLVMFWAAWISSMDPRLTVVNLIAVFAVCLGLCGMAVGLGARFPMLHERNAAKIANGLGGTINLICSVGMGTAILTICFLIGFRFARLGAVVTDRVTVMLLAALLAVGLLGCIIPMALGRRHLARLEY